MARKPPMPRTQSPKAGRPPTEPTLSPRVKRRRETARVELVKGQSLFQTGHGPRVREAVKRPKVKKR